MGNSRDYDELKWAWTAWRNATGPQMRSLFTEKVSLFNKGAKDSGYTDLSQNWIGDFEDADFESKFDALFVQIKPIYEQLHAYVRRRLINFYGENYFNNGSRFIPAHLLGK